MIAGGGFHGKSTLLDALAHGCYNHVPGNGREFVVTSEKIVSLQSEDGRSIRNVDISPFIGQLPGTDKVTTDSFRTEDASGSTSMAASVVEALELGADTLLFDEDTCATNFLIRDTRMQRLVKSDPIVPLIYNIRAMLRDTGVSSILVIGGCGDYCDVADLVLEMRDYLCYDITETARKIAAEIPSTVTQHEKASFPRVQPRHIHLPSLPEHAKLAVRRLGVVDVAHAAAHAQETLDLRALSQLVSASQTRAVASALKALAGIVQNHELLHALQREAGDSGDSAASADEARAEGTHGGRVKQWTTLRKATRVLSREIDERGLDCVMEDGRLDPFLAKPRAIDVGLAINRLRSASLRYVTAHEDAGERPQ
ncbi:hypothetical protein PsYK624_056630 [Phanerochaete sordida]|uniref:ATPase n=1 Tax=Phanerochaete sordida TaxID=48140 RepID=A0A9P3LBU3_9APHY|nr:hypothetical protein PsYK624_056630 [Phanerochaete sordida]